jgi:hypothetical protein
MSKWFDTLVNDTCKENVEPQEDLYEEDVSMQSEEQDTLDVILDILVELRDLLWHLKDTVTHEYGRSLLQKSMLSE